MFEVKEVLLFFANLTQHHTCIRVECAGGDRALTSVIQKKEALCIQFMPIWNNKPEDDHETTVVVHDLAEEKKLEINCLT